MGIRSSKNNRNSYSIAPAVANKDFTYKKHARPLPKVELPAAIAMAKNDEGLNDTVKQEEKINSVEKETTTTNETLEEKNETQDPRIPNWVNKENFKKLVYRTHPNIKDIIGFEAFPAMAAGENFSTLILRVKAKATFEDDKTKDFSYMLKVNHDTKEMQDILKTLNCFTIENAVYTEVIPELEEMYRQKGVEFKVGAKSHSLDLEDTSVNYILLDDLSVDGFKNANRLECLNMEHTLSVLRKMAQFHAASACRVAKNGSYSKLFSPNIDNEIGRAVLNQMFTSFKKPFLDNLKTYKNGEKYYDIMANFIDNLVELYTRSGELLSYYFCVLNHGDSWCNNILFKYAENGEIEETLFVDFQNSKWSSPAIDLYYFIMSSVQIDIKLTQFDYFIRYYYEHLSKNLKLLEYPLVVPNLKDLEEQLCNFGSMATMTSFLTMGIVLLDPTESARFENFFSDSEEGYKFKNSMYSNERYRIYINEVLPWLYDRGFMQMNLTELENKIAAVIKLNESEHQRNQKMMNEI